MAKVELKAPVVQEIAAKIDGAQSAVLVDHRGMTVAQDTELRKRLREAGVEYKVYKNTMMNFAFKGTDCEGLAPYLEGPSAMAYSTEDATAPARAGSLEPVACTNTGAVKVIWFTESTRAPLA